jgi:hypothetical protein
MIDGNFSAWLGSVWFACFTAFAGYIAGHVFPVSRVADLFKRKG